MSNNYTADSIKSLEYFSHIRQYPGMYIGSKDLNGLHHLIKEIISNSIDEWLNGTGNKIVIKLLKDNGIYVGDYGRGIPHGDVYGEGSPLWACFGKAHTGGKFDNETGESGYNTSGGQHGTGAKAVNALSKKLIVSTMNNGLKETVEFSRGKIVSHKEQKIDSEHGLEVIFYPDETVLDTIQVDVSKLKNMIREFSFLCKGLTFEFENENNAKDNEVFLSENGLYDYLAFLNKNKTMITDVIHFEAKEGKYEVEVAFAYNETYGSNIKLYTNNIPQEKGTHLTGFKTALTSSLNSFARENKLLKDKDENLKGTDFEEGQLLIINFRMIDPVFKGQNKEELSSAEGRTYVQRLTTDALKSLFDIRKEDFKAIVEKAIDARKAREAARAAKDKARNKVERKKNKLEAFDSKLADCYGKDRQACELYLVEGK